METVSITIYSIDECGYYDNKNNFRFFNTTDLMVNLKSWIAGKKLINTKTFDPPENSDLNETYIYGMEANGNDFLLCTWNRIESTNGNVAAIHEDAVVGDAEIIENPLAEGSIPGFATYFWIMPNEGKLATIRFQHRQNGHRNLTSLINSYMRNFSPHVLIDDTDLNNIIINGYTRTPGQRNQIEKVKPKFIARVASHEGQLAMLKNNAHKIRKLVRRTTLSLKKQDHRELWQKITDFFTNGQPKQKLHTNIEYTIDIEGIKPEQLDSMYRSWSRSTQNDDWSDFGFTLTGQANKTYWIGHGLMSGKFDINPFRENAEILRLNSLLSELCRIKDNVLTELS
jgi:hypothetical protein